MPETYIDNIKTEMDNIKTETDLALLRARRKEAGLRIDPATAETFCCFGLVIDPYGEIPDLPSEYWQFGRNYFARSPGSDVWVSFDDLPTTTRKRLWAVLEKPVPDDLPDDLPW